jgi:transposase
LYPAVQAPAPAGRARCYPSDTTDAEWALLEPLLPVPAHRTARGGRPEAHHRREIVDAIRYLVDNGCKWRALPTDFPPWRTVYGFHARWAQAGVIAQIRTQLHQQVRIREGRNPQPTAAIIDSQSVKAAETVGATSRGFDAGKKINGRKRHIAVDTLGLLLFVMVTAANLQDRSAARDLLWRLKLIYPTIQYLWADSGYTGTLLTFAAKFLGITIEIVKKIAGQTAFVVLPRRWVVERTLSWLTQARRNVRDYERLPQHSEALITWAAITVMTRRLTRPTRPT